jgi:hypothetical protein
MSSSPLVVIYHDGIYEQYTHRVRSFDEMWTYNELSTCVMEYLRTLKRPFRYMIPPFGFVHVDLRISIQKEFGDSAVFLKYDSNNDPTVLRRFREREAMYALSSLSLSQ